MHRSLPVNTYQPLNSSHPLNKERALWLVAQRGLIGGAYFYDLVKGVPCFFITGGIGTMRWSRLANPGGVASMRCTGNNACVVYPGYSRTPNFTVSGWVQMDDPALRTICVAETANGSGWRVRIFDASNQLTLTYSGVADYRFTGLVVPSGTWFWFCITVSGTVARGYLGTGGGSLRSQVLTGLGTASATNRFTLSTNNGSTNLIGIANDISVHSRNLDRAEVNELYRDSLEGHPYTINRISPLNVTRSSTRELIVPGWTNSHAVGNPRVFYVTDDMISKFVSTNYI